jgi:hypothetical protein
MLLALPYATMNFLPFNVADHLSCFYRAGGEYSLSSYEGDEAAHGAVFIRR